MSKPYRNNNYRKGSSSNKKRPRDASQAKKEALGADLATLLTEAIKNGDDPFQGFVGLTKDLKRKQEEIDTMAADSLPAAILTDYVSDTLLPNSNGDLITVIADDQNTQQVVSNIYERLAIPPDKVVYSLLKNGIAIGEFEQVFQKSVASQVAAANESVSSQSEEDQINELLDEKRSQMKMFAKSVKKAVTESTKVREPGTIMPNIAVLSDTYTVFPIIRYEKCIGYIEVRKDISQFKQFNWETDSIDYTDVVIHPLTDYVYETFGVNHSSKPMQISVKDSNGDVYVYDVAQGTSILEDAYSAWKTLALLQDSIVLTSLIKNTQIMLIEVEAGTASKQQIEASKIKLRNLFEGQLAMGRQGMKSYLNPQSKPAFIYSFTSNGVGKITPNFVGGEYNPGQLYYLNPFYNSFFSAMGAPKQNYGFTEGSAGLDGGGAVEQYNVRWKSNVALLKRLLGSFYKKAINNVLVSKGFTNLVNKFDVKVWGAYDEITNNEAQALQTKLTLFDSILEFTKVEDPAKTEPVRSLMLKQIITNPQLVEAIDKLFASTKQTEEDSDDGGDIPLDEMNDSQMSPDVGGELGLDEGGGGIPEEREVPMDMGGGEELPEMSDVLGGDTEE